MKRIDIDGLKKFLRITGEYVGLITAVALSMAFLYVLWMGISSPIKEVRIVCWVIIGLIFLTGFCQSMANRSY
jgi:hypothetical protein